MLAVVLGGLAIAAVLLSAIKTVVLPRAAPSVITRMLFSATRRLFFDALAPARLPFERRDRVLALYAPLTLVLLPGVWVALMMVGFTLVFWGTGLDPLREAFVASGSSLLTLGFVRPTGLGHIVLTFVEATLGLGLMALLISYLPTLYGAFNRRETLVGMLEVRAGIPPSAGECLVRYHRIGMLTSIEHELFSEWEHWFSDVEESHTSFPALCFFRSPQPGRSWVTSAGCVLDSAALVQSAVDQPSMGETAVMIRTGFFCLRRVADNFGIAYDPDPSPTDPISVTRKDFDQLLAELQAAGVPLRPDRDRAWRDFAGWRVNYDTVVLGLSRLVVAPPAPWSTDRLIPVVRRGPRRWADGREA
jgi:hypothetical protein